MLTLLPALSTLFIRTSTQISGGTASFQKVRRFSAAVLIINLLGASLQPVIASSLRGTSPGVFSGISSDASQGWTNVNTMLGLAAPQDNGMPDGPPVPEPQEVKSPPTKAEKEAKVASIQLNLASENWIPSKQRFVAGAIPLDKGGNAVHGLAAEWTTSDRVVVFITKNGMALAGKPGSARLTAQAGNKTESIRVNVFDDGRGSTRSSQASVDRKPLSPDKMVARVQKRNVLLHHARLAPMPAGTDDRLPDAETSSLYEPKNDVGKPEGRTEASAQTIASANSAIETPGSANYTFGVPLVGIPGRQLSAALALTYNSRIWHKAVVGSTTKMYFDVDAGWPAPGFRLGYGQIEHQGTSGFTLTEPDGTRRKMVTIGTSLYRTTDGSLITYSGSEYGGSVTYPDGTKVWYGSTSGPRNYPGMIEDRHGNVMYINYVGNVGPKISNVQDTLHRFIQFHYSGNDLVAITAPAYNGATPDRQVARFYYEDLTLVPSSLFAWPIQVTAPSTTRVLRYVYLPGTQNGYRYDYSAYGMIYKTSQLRAMSVSTTSLTAMGSVTADGDVAATSEYNYPVSAVTLSDAPKYTARTDDWAGRTTGSAPTWSFAVDDTTGTSTVTGPDSTVTETLTDPTTGQVQSVSTKYGGTVLAKTAFSWQTSTAGPRLEKVEATNEAGQTRATSFTYDAATIFNNVSVVSERDFATTGTLGTELRRVETTYENSTNYTNRGLIHLPKTVKVFGGGSSTPSSHVAYTYDGGTLTDRPGIEMYDQSHNPYAPPEYFCDWVWNGHYEEYVCNWIPTYNPSNAYRGNVTSVTAYANAAAGTSPTTNTMTYDIAGNVVEQTVNCCRRKTFSYSGDYDFAYVTSTTSGEYSQLSSSASYDINTGLTRTTVNENNRTTTIHYDPASLRTSQVIRPQGSTTFAYNDGLVQAPDSAHRYSYVVTTTQRDAGNSIESRQYRDGRGSVARSFGSYTATQGWVTQDVEYDNAGRVFRSSQPYYSTGSTSAINPSGLWTTNTFDRLDRVTSVSWPSGDSGATTSSASISYAGTVTTTTDAAFRQKRQITDALGRLIYLDEPDMSGNLGTTGAPTQRTTYEYDPLDNLTKITQGSQVRQFKYDSLSHLTHEKQVEANATLNDSGGSGSSWTAVFVYNSFGLLTDAYDARGARAQMAYDTLNRLKTVSHSGEALQTPTTTYTYGDEVAPSPPADSKGRLYKVETSAVGSTPTTAQEFDYDLMGGVTSQRQKIGGSTYTLGYGYNYLGQLTSSTNPSGRVITYGFDAAARLASVSDSANRISASALTYAAHGGMTSENWGNGAVQSVSYNRSLQPKTLTLNRSGELQRFEYKYGVTDINTGTVDEGKNAGQVGRIESFINGTKQWQQRFNYDSVDRLTKAKEVRGDNSQQAWQVAYTHDRWGNRFQSGADNSGVSFEPVVSADINTANNRFNSSTADPLAYNNAGQITEDNKFRGMKYSYDANGRMREAWRYEGGGYTAATFDGAGQRVQMTIAGVTRNFVYNLSGQVVAEYRQGVLDREYVYQGGALLASDEQPRTCTMTTDQYVRNFYTGTLGRQPNAPELQQWTGAIDQALAQGYGAVLAQVRSLGTTLFTSTEYVNRNRTNSEFVIDLYWGYLHRTYDQGGYDNWMAALNGGTTREQVRGGFAFSTEFENNAAGVCTTTGGTAAVKYVFLDHQGSARAVMDGAGSVVARHDYLPFGEELWSGAGMRTTAQQFGAMDQNRMRYALTEKDEATGLDHTWFRKYENASGRWTTPDPMGGSTSDPQTFNRYAYVANDPVNMVDPSGLMGSIGPWWNFGWGSAGADQGWNPNGVWGQGNLMDRPRNIGRDNIAEAERTWTDLLYRFMKVDEAMVFGYDFQGRGGPCEYMARNAQNDANLAILQSGGANASALAAFDVAFSGNYLGRDSNGKGRPMNSLSNVARYAKGGSRTPLASGSLLGQSDFQERFKEISPYGDAMDQTHHVAAYMSLGINNRVFSEYVAERVDRRGGARDRLLGAYSYVIGNDLQRDPSRLRSIGDRLRSTMCAP